MWNWIFDIFRTFISLFDMMVYWLIELLVSLFNALASAELFSGDAANFIDKFSDRLYIIITIVMIFKVSFSIIQYIINPDTFTEKERGIGKTIQNVILVLVCLVGVKYVFNFAYDLQKKVVDKHIIEQLILGINTNLNAKAQEDISDAIPFTVLSSFVSLNTSEISNFGYSDNFEYVCNDGAEHLMFDAGGNSINKEFSNCIDQISKEGIDSYVIDSKWFDGDTGAAYAKAYETSNYNLLLKLVNHRSSKDYYIFNYKYIISTAAGIFVVIMYFNFCIDLAVRSVKFAFLQLIAPIPIISMIDPKSSKSGMMSKWVKNSLSTYSGLFVRVAAVSFATFIVSIAMNPSLTSNLYGFGSWQLDIFVKLFVMFGAFLFAKELPKLISDLTGVSLNGDFKLNPLTRLPGGKTVTNVAKGAGLAAGSMIGAGAAIAGRTAVSTLATPGQALLHKINPNKFTSAGEMWRGAGNAMSNRLYNNSSNALRHLRSGLPKFMQGSAGGSGNNSQKNEYRENRQLLDLGESLYHKVHDENNGDMNSIFQNREFADNVANMQSAKSDMIDANSRLEEIKARANSGDVNAQAMLGDAMRRAKQTSDLYEERKKHVDMLGQRYKKDYKNLQAYKAYKDLYGDSSTQQVAQQPFTGYQVAQQPPASSNTMPSVTPPSGGNGNQNGNNNP